ncbi:PREDICTED: GATA transcription factor 3 [Camelina sativa]|uniref:GATA transcription factor n=1 Tax=Camelina sativa TaxID=90675 RepID=A0ABM0TW82_CAMSA|nr:PREDICTED: GATA transcription factor 3 [Camelina sativa]
MELWTEARALKASLRGESTTSSLKHHQVIVSEDLSRTSSLPEDFSVECFLDFSEGQQLKEEEDELVSASSSQEEQEQEQDCVFSSQPCLFDQLPSLPDEDVEELEWVSRVVDDCSSPEVSLLFKQTHKTKPNFSSRIPVKPRTKRSRNSLTGGRVWPLVSANHQQHAVATEKWRKKKQETAAVVFQRRCSHCGTNNTPQWRTGPVGPKTLCNACGVRFKSGRLCPEYRPADSPTFSNEIHSNLHRKVLELRKSKELGEETGEASTKKSDQVKFGSKW